MKKVGAKPDPGGCDVRLTFAFCEANCEQQRDKTHADCAGVRKRALLRKGRAHAISAISALQNCIAQRNTSATAFCNGLLRVTRMKLSRNKTDPEFTGVLTDRHILRDLIDDDSDHKAIRNAKSLRRELERELLS